jgi:ribose 5-phosphate isomerase B
MKKRRIALGCDHRGYDAKKRITAMLEQAGCTIHDFGTDSSKSCDYPDAALAAGEAVQRGECDVGLLFCGTGIGMSIAANKVKGIRAAVCHDELTAEMSRRHNNANVLCLPADLVGEALMERIVEVWLETDYEGGRHDRRLDKINEFEKRQCAE